MTPEALRALLREAHTIAVVGLSPKACGRATSWPAICKMPVTASSP